VKQGERRAENLVAFPGRNHIRTQEDDYCRKDKAIAVLIGKERRFFVVRGQRHPDNHSEYWRDGKSSKKRSNLNPAKTMDVNAWRARQFHKRFTAYLDQREQEFLREHGKDSDEELIAYVRRKADEFHRMPHHLELPGGKYLQTRLGDWNTLARRIGYKPLSPEKSNAIYQRIKRSQEEAFARERRALKTQKLLSKVARDKQKNQIQEKAEKEKHNCPQ